MEQKSKTFANSEVKKRDESIKIIKLKVYV